MFEAHTCYSLGEKARHLFRDWACHALQCSSAIKFYFNSFQYNKHWNTKFYAHQKDCETKWNWFFNYTFQLKLLIWILCLWVFVVQNYFWQAIHLRTCSNAQARRFLIWLKDLSETHVSKLQTHFALSCCA